MSARGLTPFTIVVTVAAIFILLHAQPVSAAGFVCGTTNWIAPGTRTKTSLQTRYATAGARSVLVFRVDFTNAPGAAISEQQAKDVLASVDGFFRQSSFFQLSFPRVDVTPVLRLPGSKSDYGRNTALIAQNARAAAEAAGYDLSVYDFEVFTFPPIGLGASGLGWIGGKGVWIEGANFIPAIVAHELGHNLGLPHANLWKAPDDSIIGEGKLWEYGNSFDAMGSSPAYPASVFNANFRYLLGWLSDRDVHVASSNGVYRLYSMDSGQPLDPDKRYAIRVPAAAVFDGLARDYWIDIRQAMLFPHAVNGIFIKAATPSFEWLGNILLDMTPATETVSDAALVVGRTFADASHGIYITPIKKGSKDDVRWVDVVINRNAATNRSPAVDITAPTLAAAPYQVISFQADASDPDGDELSYFWEFGDETLPSSLNSSFVTKGWPLAGTYPVRCIVSDMKGGVASKTVVVTVGAPTNQTISGHVLFQGEPLQDARVYATGPGRYSFTSSDSSGFYLLSGLPDGTNSVNAVKSGYSFEAVQIPSGPDATNVNLEAIVPVPQIGALQPAHGRPGATVLVQGTNLAGATSVRFGDESSTFTVLSSSALIATVPANAGDAPLSVITPYGSATSAGAFVIDPAPPPPQPRIDGITPGHAEAGASVVIVGVNFSTTASVRFGDVEAEFRIFSPSAVRATVPMDAATAVIVVTTADGSATSAVPFVVDSPRAVLITQSPMGGRVTEGSNAVFRVSVTGSTPIGFQWQKDGAALPGATSGTLVVTNVTEAAEGAYSVVVTNRAGRIISEPAQLEVLTLGRALAQPGWQWATSDGNAWFGQTNVSVVNGASAQSARGTNASWVETTIIGPSLLSFWWQLSAGFFDESVDFLLDGTNYARISGPAAWSSISAVLSEGSHVLRWERNARAETTTAWLGPVRAEPLWFTTSPEGRTTVAGIAVEMGGEASGAARYQWLRDGLALQGATNPSIRFSAVLPGDAGDYQLVINSGTAQATSVVATLTVLPLQITQEPASLDVNATSNATFEVVVESTVAPAYQWYFEDEPVGAGPVLTFRAMPEQAGSYRVVASNLYGAVTSAPATLLVRSQAPQVGAAPDELHAYAGETLSLNAAVTAVPDATYTWRRNGRRIRGGTNATLVLPKVRTVQRGDFSVVAQNTFGAVTQHIRVGVAALTVSQPPASQKVLIGDPLVVSVTAESASPIRYQWRFNGSSIAGATNASHVVPAAARTNSGLYDVVLRSKGARLRSTPARVDVVGVAPEFAEQPGNREAGLFSRTTFSALATGRPPPVYQWYRNGAPLPGRQTRSFTLDVLSTSLEGNYTVTASNEFGIARSAAAYLTVVQGRPHAKIDRDDLTAVAGDFVVLRDAGTAWPPVTNHQWSLRHTNIVDATNGVLVLPRVTADDAGKYRVIDANDLGQDESGATDINVRAPLALDLWEWSAPLPRSEDLQSAAFGNGIFLATGESGAIIGSPDGVTWNDWSLLSTAAVSSVVFAAGEFLAVVEQPADHPVVLASSNGRDWAAAVLPENQWRVMSVASAGGEFVIAGADEQTNLVICTSRDGTTWATSFIEAPAAAVKVATGGQFVALAGSSTLTSPDGSNWVIGASLDGAAAICFGNGEYVVAGDHGAIWTSPDGLAWNSRKSGTSDDLRAVHFWRGQFVAAGENGTILTSATGSKWVRATSGSPAEATAVAASEDQIAIFGKGGVILTSTDGLSWSNRLRMAAAGSINAVLFTNGTFVAVGDGGVVLASPDGESWEPRASGTSRDLLSLACGPNGYVAVGSGGKIITSADGISWQDRSLPVAEAFLCVRYVGEIYIAVGEAGRIAASRDAATWTSQVLALPGVQGSLGGVAYGQGIFVAVGGFQGTSAGDAHSLIAVSADGRRWSVLPIDWGRKLRAVSQLNGGFLAVGNDGSLASSADGVRWYQRRIAGEAENLRAVTAFPGMLLTVGNNGIVLSSPNGDDWKRQRLLSSKNLHDVCFGNNQLVAVGTDGTILHSGAVLPRLIPRRAQASGPIEFQISNGAHEYYRLEISPDFGSWYDLGIVTNEVVRPMGTAAGKEFFRLRFP